MNTEQEILKILAIMDLMDKTDDSHRIYAMLDRLVLSIKASACPEDKLSLVLAGTNGNPFSLLAKATKTMKDTGVSEEEVEEFINEASSGDYDNLVKVCKSWFHVI